MGAVLLLVPLPGAAEDATVAAGTSVGLEYTLKLDDGTTVGSNVGKEPLVYEQGDGKMPPALEEQLVGLKKGDSKKVTLSPEEGYGPRRDELVQEVDTEKIPEEARKAGTTLMSQDPSGRQIMVQVKEVNGEKIHLDMNHPLAGQTLHFDVRVVSVE